MESGKKGKGKFSKVTAAPPVKQDTLETLTKVPLKPEGPLELIEGTILKWQQPNNDGGVPITHFVVEQQLKDNSFKPLKNASSISQTQFDLQNNLLDDSYEMVTFSIKAVNMKGESEPLIESIHLKKEHFICKNSSLNVSAKEFIPFSPASAPTSNNSHASPMYNGHSLNNSYVSEYSYLCDPSAVLEMNGSYTNGTFNGSGEDYNSMNTLGPPLYAKEIDTLLEECIQNLHYEPRQFEHFIEDQTQYFANWLECSSSSLYAAIKIVELIYKSSDQMHNFRYFGAKICSQIIKTSPQSQFFFDVLTVCTDYVEGIKNDDTNPSTKGLLLFLAELYKLLEDSEQRFQIGTLLLKALHYLVSSPYDSEKSKITIIVTILKCCGYMLYPNHTRDTERLFSALDEIKPLCIAKDATMIESLENCKKYWVDDISSNSSENIISEIPTCDEVFYGPDGSVTFVTPEETEFFETSCREIDTGMNEEMEEEYEKFLAQIPNQRC